MPHLPTDFDLAHQSKEQGKWADAISYYQKGLLQDPTHTQAWHFLTQAYLHIQQPEQAIQTLEEALTHNPTASLHAHLAHLYTTQNAGSKALQHYRQALHLAPDAVEIHYQLGLFFLQQHHGSSHGLSMGSMTQQERLDAARIQFKNVITLQDNHVNAWFHIGLLALETNTLSEAEQAFQHVLQHAPGTPQACVNLGVIALKRDEGQRAIDAFTQALLLDETHLEARHNLAATFMHYDRFENALMYYDDLLKTYPEHPDYLYNAGVAEMSLGHLQKAIIHFERVLTHPSEHHFAAFTNLAAIHLRLDHRTQAISLLERARQLNPNDASVAFMHAALIGQQPTHPCLPYVTHLFNNYAFHYENHLQDTLHYQIPHHLNRVLYQQALPTGLKTLDLGCGTGLSGQALHDRSARLVGVDIAAKMLEKAREKAIYTQLIEADILSFLAHHTDTYDLIVAADVCPYLGELSPFLSHVYDRLTAHGYFFFTIEINDKPGLHLQSNMRFCHHPDELTQALKQQGWVLLQQESIIARQQQAQDVPVMLYFLQKSS